MNRLRNTGLLLVTGTLLAALTGHRAQAESYVFRQVYSTTDPAETIFPPVINDAGTVAFVVEDSDGARLLRWQSGQLEIAVDFILPSFDSYDVPPFSLDLNNSGKIIFPLTESGSFTTAVFSWDDVSGEGIVADSLPWFARPTLNDNGDVGFVTCVPDPSSPSGECCEVSYVTPDGEALHALSECIDPVTEYSYDNPDLNDSLTAAVWTRDNSQPSGVYAVRTFGPSGTSVIAEGGQELVRFSSPLINALGTIAYVASTSDGQQQLRVSGTLESVIAATTDSRFQDFHPWLDFFDYSAPSRTHALNDFAQVAFWAVRDQSQSIFTTKPWTQGVDPDSQKVIARPDFLDRSYVVDVGVPSLNNHGQIAFWAALGDGRKGVYLAEPFAKYKQFKYSRPANDWSEELIVTEYMRQSGCTITCLAMAVGFYADEVTPRTMLEFVRRNKLLRQEPGLQNSVNTPSWSYPDAARGTTVRTKANPKEPRIGPERYGELVQALARGDAVLLAVPAITDCQELRTQPANPSCTNQTCALRWSVHYVLAYGLHPLVSKTAILALPPEDVVLDPTEILIVDPGKGGSFYGSATPSDCPNPVIPGLPLQGWYLDANTNGLSYAADSDAIVEDIFDVTLKDYFDRVVYLLDDDYIMDPVEWISYGKFHNWDRSQSYVVVGDAQNNIVRPFTVGDRTPNPSVVANSPIDVILTDPASGDRYASSTQVAGPGDQLLSRCALDVPADIESALSGGEPQAPELFPPFVLSLPDELVGKRLDVEIIGIGDGAYTLEYVPGTSALLPGHALSGSIQTGEHVQGVLEVGLRGDVDEDGGIGTADLAALLGCLAGPEFISVDYSACYSQFDGDDDSDVDLLDFALLQAQGSIGAEDITAFLGCMSGPGVTHAAEILCHTHCDGNFDNHVDLRDYALLQTRTFGSASGACCQVTGQCQEITSEYCVAIAGEYQGNATTCSSVNCPLSLTGACCNQGFCSETTESTCTAEGGLYRGDESDCSNTTCERAAYINYASTTGAFSYFAPGAGVSVADDLTLALPGTQSIVGYDVTAYAPQGGSYSVAASLLTACPGQGGTVIPGSAFTWDSVPADGLARTLTASFASVTVEGTVWLSLTFSRADAGWVIADHAEKGSTADIFGVQQGSWICNASFGGNPYAGFWARLRAGFQSTTVVGVVQLPDGSPVEDADVSFSSGEQDASALDGSFSVMVAVPVGTTITASATQEIDGTWYEASTGPLTVNPGGITDAGVLTLTPLLCNPQWADGFGRPGVYRPGSLAIPGVSAMAVFDDGNGPALFAGGYFTDAGGVSVREVVKWNGASWSPLGSGIVRQPSGGAVVEALAVFDDGTGPALIAGGAFNLAGGVSVNNIAKWNGTSWSSLGSGLTTGGVSALEVFDDGTGPALYAGGSFTTAGEVGVNRIAKWDGLSWSPLGSGLDGLVYALAVFDDGNGPALYAGGNFLSAGGSTAFRMAKWDGSAWTALHWLNSDVRALTVFNDGAGAALYAAGSFTAGDGVNNLPHVARWNGVSWTSLGGGVNGVVYSLATFDIGDGVALYAGGGFTIAGGVGASRLAKWNGASWSPLGSGVNGVNAVVSSLAVFDDGAGPVLHAGGYFTRAGDNSANCIAKWRNDAWAALGNGVNETIKAFTVFDDTSGPALYAGGGFTTTGGGTNYIAKWNGTSWSAVGSGMDNWVHALCVFDDGLGPKVCAGGDFTIAGGVSASRIAKWNGTGWLPLGSGLSDSVRALCVFDDGTGPALYAGGGFTSAGGVSASRIAKWDGTAWLPLGSGLNSSVVALCVFDDGTGPALYAGGSFTSAGGVSAGYIAKWDGAGWSPLGSGMARFGTVSVDALTTFDDGTGLAMYAGGCFDTSGGVVTNDVAKWNGAAWLPLGSGVTGCVRAMSAFDDGSGAALYVGGGFSGAGGVLASDIAKWNGSSWSALGSGIASGMHINVSCLSGFGDGTGPALYAGGQFRIAGGEPAYNFAKWFRPPPPCP